MTSRRAAVGVLALPALLALGTATARAQEDDRIPLWVEMLTRAVSKLPFVIALDQWLFAKYGLDIEVWMPPPNFAEGGIEVEGEQPDEPDLSGDGLTPTINRMAGPRGRVSA